MGTARVGPHPEPAGCARALREEPASGELAERPEAVVKTVFRPCPRVPPAKLGKAERRAAEHDIPYRKPSKYPPAETLTSARLALLGAMEGWCADFVEEAFRRHWTEDILIGTEDNLRAALRQAGRDPDEALRLAKTPAIKESLKKQTEEAAQLGIFGSPTFLVEGEMFWGDDRLEQALAWARGVE